MPVTGLSTSAPDLGRRSMMAMKDGSGGGGAAIPPDAFAALAERVRIVEDRLEAVPTRSQLSRAATRALAIGAAIGAVGGCVLAIAIGRMIG